MPSLSAKLLRLFLGNSEDSGCFVALLSRFVTKLLCFNP